MNLAMGLTLLCVPLLWLLPGSSRKHLLLVVTLVFWLLMSPTGLAWMLSLSSLAWIVTAERRHHAIFAVIAAMVAVLLSFKAAAMLNPRQGWLLPMGMSYYLFRCISYMLDVKWGNARRLSFEGLLLYAAFFPAALAGPVDRSATFSANIDALPGRSWDHKEIRHGLFLILAGLLAKLVISGRLERLVHVVYANPEACGAVSAAAAVLVFPWQLYFDFGGYTLMALGMAKLLGVHLPPNFNRPFLAPTVTEFWNRWHMSMSGWFRDYVYTPVRFALRRHRTAGIWVSSLVSFLLVGVWHGAGWGFLLLGLIQGVAVAAETFLGRRGTVATPLTIGRTYLIVAFSLIFFQARDVPHAGQVMAALGRLRPGDFQTILDTINKLDFGVLLILVPCFQWITTLGWFDTRTGADQLDATPQPVRWLAYAMLVSSVLVLSVFEHTPFVYARF